jgi:hypothetical protein
MLPRLFLCQQKKYIMIGLPYSDNHFTIRGEQKVKKGGET